jgi:hypothetical protein
MTAVEVAGSTPFTEPFSVFERSIERYTRDTNDCRDASVNAQEKMCNVLDNMELDCNRGDASSESGQN